MGCAGHYDRSGSFGWPDKVEWCGATAVHVASQVLKTTDGTCHGYCRSLRDRVPGFDHAYHCYMAWPAKGGCDAYRSLHRRSGAAGSTKSMVAMKGAEACAKDRSGHDAVCACAFSD